MFWSHQPIAPWQTPAWLNEMGRSLRPNQYARMIENRFVSTDNPLIDLSYFDAVVDENYRAPMVDRELPVWIGVDASVRHDSTALAAVTWDRAEQRVRLVSHRIFTPSLNAPIDFENSIEQTIHTWRGRFLIRGVWFDPFQMVSSAQRLARDGIRMTEFPQSLPNLTEASNNLLELIRSRRLLMYHAPDIRQAMARAVLIGSARGSRIGKTTTSHHIDVVVAMAMACLAAVRSAARSRLRMGLPLGADGFGPVIQVDPVTLQPLNERRSRLAGDPKGVLRIVGGDNTCWTREELQRRRSY